MLKRILIISLLWATTCTYGQSLEELNAKRLKTNKTGMKVLGTWAVANMVASPILKNNATGSEKYFHEMNLYWNAFNLAIASAGYIGSLKDDPSKYDLKESIKEQQKIEKILLFNTGLDIGYVAAGFFLNERGKRKNDLRLEGYGNSLKLQGAFLAVFDLFFYLAHHKNAKQLLNILDNVSPSAQGLGLKFQYKF